MGGGQSGAAGYSTPRSKHTSERNETDINEIGEIYEERKPRRLSIDTVISEDEGGADCSTFRGGVHKWKFETGDIYLGEWKDGSMHGKGTLSLKKEMAVYHGEFKDNKFHGAGIFAYSNGDIHKGSYENGLRHGRGYMDFANGDTVKESVWVNGMETCIESPSMKRS